MSNRMKRAILLFSALAFSAVASAREPIPMKWTIDGTEREALVFSPAANAASAAVVFGFHGHGGNMRFAARGMHFQDAWPEAIVVYMQGLPGPSLIPGRDRTPRAGWQFRAGELNNRDLKFFDAVLKTLHEKYSVDDNRIYASGFSNGGIFTYLLWSERPDVFAALAPGGAVILPGVHVSKARSVLHYGGRRDRLVKFENQERTIEQLRRLNNCSASGKPCGEYCTFYPSSSATPVETVIYPAGHIYPPPVTALIIKFFQEHPRKS